jgi:hypothetical protein
MKNEVKCNWTEKYLLGKVDGQRIYISAPSWDCGWYWGFGYLGNKDCHYHLSGLNREKNINLKDAIDQHFDKGTSLFCHDALTWTFTELVSTAYQLKETAEVLGRGGSHYTSNPLTDLITNKDEVERINKIVLPSIFNEIEKTLIALDTHQSFLKDQSGMFVLTDGHYNLCLEIMTYKQITDFMQWRKDQGFNTEKDRIEKIKQGEIFTSGKGNNLVKLYDVVTGECSVMLENNAYADSANEKLKKQIFEYRKA